MEGLVFLIIIFGVYLILKGSHELIRFIAGLIGIHIKPWPAKETYSHSQARKERERRSLEQYLGIPVSQEQMDDLDFQFGVSVFMEEEADFWD